MSHEIIVKLLMDRLPSDYPDSASVKQELNTALQCSNDYELTWKQVLNNSRAPLQKSELTRDQLLALYCHPDRVFALYGSDPFFRDLQTEGHSHVNEFLKNVENRLGFELIGFNLSDIEKVNKIIGPLIELEKWRWLNFTKKDDLQELTYDDVHRELLDDHVIKVISNSNDREAEIEALLNGFDEKPAEEKSAVISQTEPPTSVKYATLETPYLTSLSVLNERNTADIGEKAKDVDATWMH